MKRKIVVKMGGSTLDTENILARFAEAVARVSSDCDIVVVHGGGKDIGRQLERMGREFQFIDGLRVTDDDVIDAVEMVLSGIVNKWITRALEKQGVRAVGISGTDLGLFHAKKLIVKGGDLGYVGSKRQDILVPLVRHRALDYRHEVRVSSSGYCEGHVPEPHQAGFNGGHLRVRRPRGSC